MSKGKQPKLQNYELSERNNTEGNKSSSKSKNNPRVSATCEEIKRYFAGFPDRHSQHDPDPEEMLPVVCKLDNRRLSLLKDAQSRLGGNLLLYSSMEERFNPLSFRLIQLGFDVNSSNYKYSVEEYGVKTPLYWAQFKKNTELADALISNGADIDLGYKKIKFDDHTDWKKLAFDNTKQYVNITQRLAENGVDVSSQSVTRTLLENVTAEDLALLLRLGINKGIDNRTIKYEFTENGAASHRQKIWLDAVSINNSKPKTKSYVERIAIQKDQRQSEWSTCCTIF
jgi:hypothetical protein